MPFPVPHIDVPIVDARTGKCTWQWMQYFTGLQSDVQAADNSDSGLGSGGNIGAALAAEALSEARMAPSMRRQPISSEAAVAAAAQRHAVVEGLPQFHTSGARREPSEGFGFTRPVTRSRWSEFAFIADTEASQANYPAANYPESYYLATDTYKTFYSSLGAWTPIYLPQFNVMLNPTADYGAMKSGTLGAGAPTTMSRDGIDGAYADHQVKDEAYGSNWNGATTVPTKNAVYDKIETIVGRYTPLFDHFANAGNTGTGEDDLYSDALAAAQLATNGDKIYGEYAGTFVLSATATRQLRAYFGGTLIFDTGALSITGANASWNVWVELIRVSSSVVRCAVAMNTSSAAFVAYSTYTEVTGLTLADPQILKITGEAAGVGAATDDIVARLGSVAYVKAA